MLTVSSLSGTLSPISADEIQEERNQIDTYNDKLAEWQGSFREKIVCRITGTAPVSDSDFLSYPDAPSVIERQCGTPQRKRTRYNPPHRQERAAGRGEGYEKEQPHV